MRLLLVRRDDENTGISGILSLPSGAKLMTLELPWKNNEKKISCIPLGIYECRRVLSPKFGDTFEVCGVPNREHILFHKGNKLKDTHGCILLGLATFVADGDEDGILDSAKAFEFFKKELVGHDEFDLEIR